MMPMLISLLMFWLLAASIYLWIRWIRGAWLGHWPLSGCEREAPLPSGPAFSIAACFVFLLLGNVLSPQNQPDRPATLDAVQAITFFNFSLFAALLLLDALPRRHKPPHLSERFRLAKRDVAAAIELFLAALAPVLLLILLMSTIRTPETEHALLRMIKEDRSPLVVLWLVLSVVVSAPLAEEYLFRVVVQDRLRLLMPTWVAIVLVAVLFAAVHGWPDMIPLFPLALILGYGYEQTRSFGTVVLVHALFNALNLGLAWLGVGEV